MRPTRKKGLIGAPDVQELRPYFAGARLRAARGGICGAVAHDGCEYRRFWPGSAEGRRFAASAAGQVATALQDPRADVEALFRVVSRRRAGSKIVFRCRCTRVALNRGAERAADTWFELRFPARRRGPPARAGPASRG